MKIIIPIAMGMALAACASDPAPPVATLSPIASEHVLSTPASSANVFVLNKNTDFMICTEPQPDVGFSQSESGKIGATIAGNADSIGMSEGSQENSLGGRSPSVLMSREMFFRVCEFSRNYNLTKEEALQLFLKAMDASSDHFMAEAGAGTAAEQAVVGNKDD